MLSTVNQVIELPSQALRSQKQSVRRAQTLFVADPSQPERAELEALVYNGFHKSYHAHLTDFMPLLVGIGHGSVDAVVGIRTAAERFFIETYLSAPVEVCLADTALACKRSRLVEIGNLYSSASLHTIPLLLVAALALFRQNYEVLVFTATASLRALMARSGVVLTVLADADINALSDEERSKWGRYYDTAPQVVAVSLSAIVSTLFDNPRVRKIFETIKLQCAHLSTEIEVAS